ncbi:hypothetical protein V8G54_036036 [Vigna mungo]|uniref:Uncharacterized protein n=1 Tax=Vigna mungo TaxID=3915 RepID=A0AAQ3RF81_VIGMU
MIDKSALHHMGLQHGPDGWIFKNEYAGEDEDVAGSSSASYMPCSEFEKYMVREMHSLNILCQNINQDVTTIKGKLNLNEFDDENDESKEVKESAKEESVADESDNDMLLSVMKKNKQKKRI